MIRSCKPRSTVAMVSATAEAGSESTTVRVAEITMLESSFGGLNTSAMRRKNPRRRRCTRTVS